MNSDFTEHEHDTTNQKILIELNMIINYCLECVTWEEAKPMINMLEAVFGINAPPAVKKGILRVKKKFVSLIHGPSIHVAHSDVAVGVAEKGSNVYHHKENKKWKKIRSRNC